MANEATINSHVQINDSANLQYALGERQFTADITGKFGPAPGAFAASTAGVDVDLSEFTTAGYCRIKNLDGTNFVEVGIYSGGTFYPLMELLPGQFYVIRLSRNIGTLRVRANTASCNVIVEAFET